MPANSTAFSLEIASQVIRLEGLGDGEQDTNLQVDERFFIACSILCEVGFPRISHHSIFHLRRKVSPCFRDVLLTSQFQNLRLDESQNTFQGLCIESNWSSDFEVLRGTSIQFIDSAPRKTMPALKQQVMRLAPASEKIQVCFECNNKTQQAASGQGQAHFPARMQSTASCPIFSFGGALSLKRLSLIIERREFRKSSLRQARIARSSFGTSTEQLSLNNRLSILTINPVYDLP